MRIKSARETILLIFLIASQLTSVVATPSFAVNSTIFVDDDNSGSNELGTSEAPFNTIQEAIDAVSAGGTISVAPGNYTDIFLTEENSNTTLVGGNNVEIVAGFFATGLPTNKLTNITIDNFQFASGYSDLFLADAEAVTITNSRVTDGFQGLTLIDVKNSSVKNNVFSQNWINLVLSGNLSNTEIKFNDFVSSDLKTQIDASGLNTPDTIKLPYNWWGSSDEPFSQDKVDRNKWLVASKDTGKPSSGYHYTGDNEQIEILGGEGSTANIYVGKYYPSLEENINPMSETLIAIGSYYDIVGDEGIIAWPITVIIHYRESELPVGLEESDLQGIYYFKDGAWKLYGSDPTDDATSCRSATFVNIENNTITATVCHLTPVVAGGELDTVSPTPASGSTPTLTPTATPTPNPALTPMSDETVTIAPTNVPTSTPLFALAVSTTPTTSITADISALPGTQSVAANSDLFSPGSVLGKTIEKQKENRPKTHASTFSGKIILGLLFLMIIVVALRKSLSAGKQNSPV